MKTPNPNQPLIDEAIALAKKIEGVKPQDANTAVALGAAHTIRDQLTWHGESVIEREAKAQAEAKAAKAKTPATPTA